MHASFSHVAHAAGVGLTLCLALGSASAASPLPVDQILARNAAARGGLEAWRKVTTVSLAGKMDANEPRSSRPDYHPPVANPKHLSGTGPAPGPGRADDDPNRVIQLPYRMEMKRPRKSRLEIDFDGETAVQVYDGTNGYKVRPFLGRATPEPYTAAELALAAQEQELDGPLIDSARKGTKITADGVDKVNGADSYKLTLTLKNGAVRHVWVDATSFLEVKLDGSRTLDGKAHAEETFLKDYKTFEGLQFPTLTETVVQGVPGATRLTVESVKVNLPLDDARFTSGPLSPAAPAAPAPVKKS